MWQVASHHSGCLGKIYEVPDFDGAKTKGESLMGLSFSAEFGGELSEKILCLPPPLTLDSPVTSYHISYSEIKEKK